MQRHMSAVWTASDADMGKIVAFLLLHGDETHMVAAARRRCISLIVNCVTPMSYERNPKCGDGISLNDVITHLICNKAL